MKVYKDIFTDDEMITDSYEQLIPFDDASLADVAFEVKSKRIIKNNEDYGIAQNTDEDAESSTVNVGSDAAETVIDIVDAFNLTETQFGKKDFMTYVKGYMSKVKDRLKSTKPERVDKFMTEAQVLVKKIITEYGEFTFYLGESMDVEAMVVISRYVGEELAPRFLYFKDGLFEVKY